MAPPPKSRRGRTKLKPMHASDFLRWVSTSPERSCKAGKINDLPQEVIDMICSTLDSLEPRQRTDPLRIRAFEQLKSLRLVSRTFNESISHLVLGLMRIESSYAGIEKLSERAASPLGKYLSKVFLEPAALPLTTAPTRWPEFPRLHFVSMLTIGSDAPHVPSSVYWAAMLDPNLLPMLESLVVGGFFMLIALGQRLAALELRGDTEDPLQKILPQLWHLTIEDNYWCGFPPSVNQPSDNEWERYESAFKLMRPYLNGLRVLEPCGMGGRTLPSTTVGDKICQLMLHDSRVSADDVCALITRHISSLDTIQIERLFLTGGTYSDIVKFIARKCHKIDDIEVIDNCYCDGFMATPDNRVRLTAKALPEAELKELKEIETALSKEGRKLIYDECQKRIDLS